MWYPAADSSIPGPPGSALVLEGGGLRGIYTSGVLRYFMEKNLYLPYVIGVSMGACCAANYVSRQPERNRILNTRYISDSRYLSYRRLLLKRELFGMDFIFETIPRNLVPFEYATFRDSPQICISVATDCRTGEPLYFEKSELGDDYFIVLRASASLPLVSRPVPFHGKLLMDGGLSDSIPVRRSIQDGNRKHVLILTQPADYRKSPEPLLWLVKRLHRREPGLIRRVAERHVQYNNTIEFIHELESRGELFVFRPDQSLNIRRADRDLKKLYRAYDRGYDDARKRFPELMAYLDTTHGTELRKQAPIPPSR